MEAEYSAIADFLVFKGLFNERETGIKFISKVLETNFDENNK